jgi:hypothetical protein
VRSLLPSLTALLLLACGSGSRDSAFSVSPAQAVVRVGEKLTLVAVPNVDVAEEPSWEVQELLGGAFLNSRGMRVTYLAPQTAGTYHLLLRGRRADGAPVQEAFEIAVTPLVQLEPSRIQLRPGETLQFAARVRGHARRDLLWSVEEDGGGQVGPEGLYQAPNHPGLFHLNVRMEGFPGVLGSAEIKIE